MSESNEQSFNEWYPYGINLADGCNKIECTQLLANQKLEYTEIVRQREDGSYSHDMFLGRATTTADHQLCVGKTIISETRPLKYQVMFFDVGEVCLVHYTEFQRSFARELHRKFLCDVYLDYMLVVVGAEGLDEDERRLKIGLEIGNSICNDPDIIEGQLQVELEYHINDNIEKINAELMKKYPYIIF